MGTDDLALIQGKPGIVRVESPRVQAWVIATIVLNALVLGLGLETSAAVMDRWGGLLKTLDTEPPPSSALPAP